MQARIMLLFVFILSCTIGGAQTKTSVYDPHTLFSIAATSASITTKGILYFYVNHNVFTPGNKWNF